MKILVIGSGAREHAIVWKLLQSPKIEVIFVAPGNAGTEQIAENLPINATDITALLSAARRNKVDFTFVGPETPSGRGHSGRVSKRASPHLRPRQGRRPHRGQQGLLQRLDAQIRHTHR